MATVAEAAAHGVPRPTLDGGRHCPVLLVIHCGDPIGGGSTTDSHRGRPRGAMSPTVLKPTFTVTGLTGAGLAMMVNTASSPPPPRHISPRCNGDLRRLPTLGQQQGFDVCLDLLHVILELINPLVLPGFAGLDQSPFQFIESKTVRASGKPSLSNTSRNTPLAGPL